jgi:pimeloyl-ACP methyl ester carboxylesterase
VLVTGRDTARAAAPIVFVHGTGHAAWCWENFSTYFADAGFATYAVSLRGHGGSGGAERLRSTSVAEYVADLRSVAESLDALPILVGHSLGGLVVMRYLQRFPAAAAVLLAPAPTAGMLVANWMVGLRRPFAFLRCLWKRDFAAFYHSPGLTHALLFRRATSRAEVETLHRRIGRESFRAATEMLLPLRGRRSFDCPLLVLSGTADKVVPIRYAKKTADALGATMIAIEDGAHELMLDWGWADVAHRIAEWLMTNGLCPELMPERKGDRALE